MKILAELSEKSLGINDQQSIIGENYKLRKSARAILLNVDGCMALQHIKKYQYHKLPGGGMEVGEEIEDTLHREIKEEVGCALKITQPVGMVIEYRAGLIQLVYCFTATVVGDIGAVQYDLEEQENDQQTIWLPPKECLRLLQADSIRVEEGQFVVHREVAFLREFLNV